MDADIVFSGPDADLLRAAVRAVQEAKADHRSNHGLTTAADVREAKNKVVDLVLAKLAPGDR